MTKIEGRKDDNLLLDKGGRSFPHIVFMDADGNVLLTQEDRTVAGFDAAFKKLQRLFDLRAKAKSGDAAAGIDVTLLEGDLGLIAFDEVQRRLDGKKLSDTQTETLKDVELGAEIAEVYKAADEAAFRATAKKLADAYAAGRVPVSRQRQQTYFNVLLQYAMAEEDPDLAQKALDGLKPILKEVFGKDNQRMNAQIRSVEDKIAELREAKKKKGPADDAGTEEGCGEKPDGGK